MGKPLTRFTQPLAPHSTMSPLRVACLLLALFLSMSSGEPIEPRQEGVYQPFTLIAAHSASPVDLQSINANNSTFWIGKATSSICLTKNITFVQCPQGAITTFTWGGYAVGLVSALHLYTRHGAKEFTEGLRPRRTRHLRCPQRRFGILASPRRLLPIWSH